MPRFIQGGKGEPLPELALPPFGADVGVPPTTLAFNDDALFSVSDYIALGYTHFEATCVGAAGGKGGEATAWYRFRYEESRPVMPNDLWEAYLASLDPGVRDLVISQYPNHDPVVRTVYLDVHPIGQWYPLGMGGGGGGGGLHKVSGLLADLPDAIPIVVGKAGEHAPRAFVYNQPHTPLPYEVWLAEETDLGWGTPVHLWEDEYPEPRTVFNPEDLHDGEDGGASSFGDICQASGGKGGEKGAHVSREPLDPYDLARYSGYRSYITADGDGGDGGSGGRLLAGGGGQGSSVETENGQDGTWDGAIGKGGGGGHGGWVRYIERLSAYQSDTITPHLATSGGRGSYNFGDTSVYGPRGVRGLRTFDWDIGTPAAVAVANSRFNLYQVEAGAGGGARPSPSIKRGSYAVGFDPNGIVTVRLVKIAE